VGGFANGKRGEWEEGKQEGGEGNVEGRREGEGRKKERRNGGK